MKKKVCIVTPVFNEEQNLNDYLVRVTAELIDVERNYDWALILVDDGSRDASWNIIRALSSRYEYVKAIRFSRNFGAHFALTAGIAEADGDAVITLACDLQDPPQVCREFLRKWEAGAQVVWGRRNSRQDQWWRSLLSHGYIALARKFLPKDSKFTTGSFFLIDRIVQECFLQFRENRRLTFALVAWSGFDQEVVSYDRVARRAGQSGWTILRMFSSFYDTIVAYSDWPARFMTWLGITTFLASGGFSVYLFACWYLGAPQPGWTSLALLISVFQGFSFLMMGLVAQYLSRIYTEVVQRPLYFISEKIRITKLEMSHLK